MIPALVKARSQRGVSVGSTMMVHIFTTKNLSVPFLINEILTTVVGIVVAHVVNLVYMPHYENELYKIRSRLFKESASLFVHLANHLETGQYIWDGQEINTIHSLIEKGRKISRIHEENFIPADEWISFFEAKEKQFEHIEAMVTLLSRVDHVVIQGKMLSTLLREVAEKLEKEQLMDLWKIQQKIGQLCKDYEIMDLPKTRKEFMVRSALLHSLYELEEYLKLYRIQLS
jgi:uncharacterized membrane protein YgaE (UPF0421/DUF939 family)